MKELALDTHTPALEEESRGETFAQSLADLWNALVSRPRVIELSASRRRHVARRFKEHPDLEWWRAVIARIAVTPFLRGAGSRGWMASFDWLIQNDTNALRVLEGRYDSAPVRGARDGMTMQERAARYLEDLRKAGYA